MKGFEYVMSGLSLTRAINGFDTEKFFPQYVDVMNRISTSVLENIKAYNTCTTSDISLLFNAFTENTYGDKIINRKRMGLCNVYADSGGLQIITAGKSITPELKKKVYETQTKADFGFCFDTIPLERVTPVRSKSERSNTANKLFRNENFVLSAAQTGKDICEQLSYFEKSKSNTKGFVIVQGNDPEDMTTWFRTVMSQIPESLWGRIQGIALADTCMGNGTLETVDMMIATRRIAEEFGTQYTKHIHLLGVGSITRMKPVINLLKSGYLNCVEHISYDSTTHTSSMINGRYFEGGKFSDIPAYRCPESTQFFTKLYNRFESIFSEHVTLEKYLEDIVFCNETWSTSALIYVDHPRLTVEQDVIAKNLPLAGTLMQVESFMKTLDDEYASSTMLGDSVQSLAYVKTHDDMQKWMTNCSYLCDSKRIVRSENMVSLLNFMED